MGYFQLEVALFLYLRFMIKKSFFIGGLILLSACSGKDEQFCKCLEAGETLNNYTITILENETEDANREKLKSLRDSKNEACEAYEKMPGGKLRMLKEECAK